MKDAERQAAATEALEFLRSVVADAKLPTIHRLEAAAILLRATKSYNQHLAGN